MNILQAAAQQGGQGSGFFTFLPMIVMFAIIYFLLIRPQMKRQRTQQTMLGALSKGDKVLTRGGVYGTIEAFKGTDDQQVILDVGKGTKITVARPYIVGPAATASATPDTSR